MLDHVFIDAIGALRTALELAMLERQAVEERFTTDALTGDTRWDTSYSLPGESLPPSVQADLSMQWPTWSQTAYRNTGHSTPAIRGAAKEERIIGCALGGVYPERPVALANMPS